MWGERTGDGARCRLADVPGGVCRQKVGEERCQGREQCGCGSVKAIWNWQCLYNGASAGRGDGPVQGAVMAGMGRPIRSISI